MLRAKEFNILVDDVAITHLSFGTEVWPHSKHTCELSGTPVPRAESCQACDTDSD